MLDSLNTSSSLYPPPKVRIDSLASLDSNGWCGGVKGRGGWRYSREGRKIGGWRTRTFACEVLCRLRFARGLAWMAIVCASRDSNTSSRLLLFDEINHIHRELLCDCFSDYNTSHVIEGAETLKSSCDRRRKYQTKQKNEFFIDYIVSLFLSLSL